jgi:hypothetical protein
MMTIKRIIRDNDRVMVSSVDADGNNVIQYFSKQLSNDEIIALVNGEKSAVVTVPEKEIEEVKNTVPLPPPVLRSRVTREQMIEALKKAKIDVDIFDPAKLRAAYKKLISGDGK